jgi:hypothetical protein
MKNIESLATLLDKAMDGKLHIKSCPQKFVGQSGGGGGVLIISDDYQTVKQYEHCDDLEIFPSIYAYEIGQVYKKIMDTADIKEGWYNYLTKDKFWRELTRLTREQVLSAANLDCSETVVLIARNAISVRDQIIFA